MSYWLRPDAETELGDAALYYAEHANLAVARVLGTVEVGHRQRR